MIVVVPAVDQIAESTMEYQVAQPLRGAVSICVAQPVMAVVAVPPSTSAAVTTAPSSALAVPFVAAVAVPSLQPAARPVRRACPACGQSDHQRSRSALCPLNRHRLPNAALAHHDRPRAFQPERRVLAPMDVQCRHCPAIMWQDERAYRSCHRQSLFCID